MSKHYVPASLFQLALRSKAVDHDKVNYSYTWAPNIDQVFVGGPVKTGYMHSVWTGVVMTLVNVPALLWKAVIKPFCFSLWAFAVIFFVRIVAGLAGNCAGIIVDPESYNKSILRTALSDKAELLELSADELDAKDK